MVSQAVLFKNIFKLFHMSLFASIDRFDLVVLRILAGCWVNDNVLYEQRNIIVNLQLVTLNMNISIVVSNRR